MFARGWIKPYPVEVQSGEEECYVVPVAGAANGLRVLTMSTTKTENKGSGVGNCLTQRTTYDSLMLRRLELCLPPPPRDVSGVAQRSWLVGRKLGGWSFSLELVS